jgi:hypothetical protein
VTISQRNEGRLSCLKIDLHKARIIHNFQPKQRPLTTSTETSNSRQKRQHTRSDREFQKQNRNVPRPQVPRLTTVDKKDR